MDEDGTARQALRNVAEEKATKRIRSIAEVHESVHGMRTEIIFFRAPHRSLFSCHKKAYDHAPKARVHPASLSVVVAIALPFGSANPA